MDEELVQALLRTEELEAFMECYMQYTGCGTVVLGEFEADERVWKHFKKLSKAHKSPNCCTTPEGYEIYISMGLRRKR